MESLFAQRAARIPEHLRLFLRGVLLRGLMFKAVGFLGLGVRLGFVGFAVYRRGFGVLGLSLGLESLRPWRLGALGCIVYDGATKSEMR